MPTTTSTSIAGVKCAASATGAPAAATAAGVAAGAATGVVAGATPRGSAASPADFLAMLGQMLQGQLQGAPDEAGALAVEAVDGDALAGADDGDETADPATLADQTLADQLLALASLSLPGSIVPAPPARPALESATTATDDAPAEAIESLLGGRGEAASKGAALLDLPNLVTDSDDALATIDAATVLAARVDSSATQTLVSSTTQASPGAAGQAGSQLITQTAPNPFVTADAPPDPVLQRVVHASVGTAAWASELGTRLTIMAGQGQHSASLHLTPEHLGPLEVRIDMNDDKATVFFGAQHADTRAALNEALPRLRELFAASGMTLADSGVSQQAPRQESRDNAARIARALNGESSSGSIGAVSSVTSITNPSLLDLYA